MNITENINRVKEIMGLLNEQAGCEYSQYQNGDGINKPKITIQQSENGVVATYIGPETGFCIQHSKGSTKDSLHQLAGVVRVIVSGYLKTLYKQGIFVKPAMDGISMNKDDNFFKITIPFVKTFEYDAITNFNERGGWGHNASGPISDFMSSINNERYGLITKETKVASGGKSPDITEHWVSFRDLQDFPIKTKPKYNIPKTDETKPEPVINKPAPVVSKPAPVANKNYVTIKGTGFDDLNLKLKENARNISILDDSIRIDMKNFTISYVPGNTKLAGIYLITETNGNIQNKLVEIMRRNPGKTAYETGEVDGVQWAIII